MAVLVSDINLLSVWLEMCIHNKSKWKGQNSQINHKLLNLLPVWSSGKPYNNNSFSNGNNHNNLVWAFDLPSVRWRWRIGKQQHK